MKELTKVEEQVMQIIWEVKKGVVRDFMSKLPEPKPPYTTISSVVRILEKKGFLDHKTYGKTYEYFPIISRDDYRKFMTKNLVSKYFSGSPKGLLSFFVKEKELSLKEMQEIINSIDPENLEE